MTEITDSELLRICQFVSNYPQTFYTTIESFINDLYTTGCRPNELLQLTRWVQSENHIEYFSMQPEKGNLSREIPKAFLSQNFINAWLGSYRPYQKLSLRQLEYGMKQVIPNGKIKVEHKEMVAYIFRYNKVKMLVGAGYNNSYIQTFFGWLNPPMPWNYNSKIILVSNPTIPVETYTLTNSRNENLIDNDQNLLNSE